MSKHRADLAMIERRQNVTAENQLKARREHEVVTAGRAETIALRSARGDVIDQPKAGRGECDKPARVYDGWDLARTDFLRSGQLGLVLVGDKYQELYRIGWASGLKVGSEPRIAGAMSDRDPIAFRARQELNDIHAKALASIRNFINVLTRVCGEGETLTAVAGAKHAIPVCKENLKNALALVAVYLRMEV